MSTLRRTIALSTLLVLPALAAARAQMGLANQMMPGYVVVPSPVFPNHAPAPVYTAPSYQPPSYYPQGVPQYLPPGGSGMAGSTFNPGY